EGQPATTKSPQRSGPQTPTYETLISHGDLWHTTAQHHSTTRREVCLECPSTSMTTAPTPTPPAALPDSVTPPHPPGSTPHTSSRSATAPPAAPTASPSPATSPSPSPSLHLGPAGPPYDTTRETESWRQLRAVI